MRDGIVIFDVDGTLCDTSAVDDECFRATAARILGVPLDPWSLSASPQITDSGILEWLWEGRWGRAPTRHEVDDFMTQFEHSLLAQLRHAPERFRALHGASRLLSQLERLGWTVALATGGWSRTARLKLRAASLPDSRLLASAEDSSDRGAIFRLAESRAAGIFGKDWARTVLVGDGIWDVRVASRFHWQFLGVGAGERAEALMASGASLVVPAFDDPLQVEGALLACEVPACTEPESTWSGHAD